jgi:beta-phosphoglucomutase
MDLNLLNRNNYLVIFDLDGVLVDTTSYHLRAWKCVTKKHNISFDPKISDQLRGISRRQSLMVILNGQEVSKQKMDTMMDEKNKVYQEYILTAKESLLLPGVEQFLVELRTLGFKLAVASSSKNAKLLLKQTHLPDNLFDAVIDGNDVKNGKPNPELFILAAKFCNISPTRKNTIVIEDAAAGIEAAKLANMGTFGIGPAKLDGCDIHLSSLADVPTAYIESYFGTSR